MNYKKFLGAASAALMIVIVLTLVLAPGAWAASKFKTLHNFTGGADGSQPSADLIFDQAGNLYGTTRWSGTYGLGVVFKLTPNSKGAWTESVLYSFTGGVDGSQPYAGLIFDQAGNLYGTTAAGGAHGVGIVFKLTPNTDGSWSETVLYSFCSFGACDDGGVPFGSLIFDAAGNLYGTTAYAQGSHVCNGGCGVVFKLTPKADQSWTESVLYSFTGGADGAFPVAGLIFDAAGNLYSTTTKRGAHGWGLVFKLTPNTDGSWTEDVLYSFTRSGGSPVAGVIFDQTGNLYGMTSGGGHGGFGTVFKLTPNQDGSWTETVLHRFTGGKDGSNPAADLIFDWAGNLYGTTSAGGAGGYGVVFKLTPNSNGGWNETVLHAFLNNPGADPVAGLTMDAAGNVYGTTLGDRRTTFGSVFEITP